MSRRYRASPAEVLSAMLDFASEHPDVRVIGLDVNWGGTYVDIRYEKLSCSTVFHYRADLCTG